VKFQNKQNFYSLWKESRAKKFENICFIWW